MRDRAVYLVRDVLEQLDMMQREVKTLGKINLYNGYAPT